MNYLELIGESGKQEGPQNQPSSSVGSEIGAALGSLISSPLQAVSGSLQGAASIINNPFGAALVSKAVGIPMPQVKAVTANVPKDYTVMIGAGVFGLAALCVILLVKR